MIEFLKRRDRILLEMYTGMVIFGLIALLIGSFFVKAPGVYAASLWLGILGAMLGAWHMAHTLDKALPLGAAATKVITAGYFTRYICVGIVLVITAVTGVFDTVVVFIGYMSLKVAAYLQPFTHKFYNKLFHETDPVASPLPDEEQGEVQEEAKEESNDEASCGE